AWLQRHLDYCASPLLSEPWVLDIDSTIKPLYGHQEGAMVGYNPQKPGRPSHCYHTYLMANLRLVLGVDVQPGDEHTAKHGQAGLWSLLHRLGRNRWPALLRGDVAWGVEPVMARAEQEGLAYLFRLRMRVSSNPAFLIHVSIRRIFNSRVWDICSLHEAIGRRNYHARRGGRCSGIRQRSCGCRCRYCCRRGNAATQRSGPGQVERQCLHQANRSDFFPAMHQKPCHAAVFDDAVRPFGQLASAV